ncbi:MAG: transcription antitermination factor NusB [Treponema sp.]|jgi:N utilization substance protein B|nr:transcription antitermination factor NusB [Treponema sp.]
MGSRRKGRILAFQALYAWAMAEEADRGDPLSALLEFPWLAGKAVSPETLNFPRLLVKGAVERIDEVDRVIKKHLLNWDFSRVGRVDQALLRLGVYEMLFQKETPAVVIDEAVGIAQEFGSDDSYRFINGVLDGVRKSMQGADGERAQSV